MKTQDLMATLILGKRWVALVIINFENQSATGYIWETCIVQRLDKRPLSG